MQIRSKRERMMLIVCVLVILIGGWMVLNPASKAGGPKRLIPLAEAVHKRDVALRTLKRMSSDQDEIQPRIERMTYTQPAEQLVPQVIRDLQNLATRANVHLQEIKPLHSHPLPSGSGERVTLEVSFRAPFQPNVIGFLYYVEAPKGKMVVDKMDITSVDARFNTVDVTAQITVFTRSVAAAAGAQGGTTDVNNKANKS